MTDIFADNQVFIAENHTGVNNLYNALMYKMALTNLSNRVGKMTRISPSSRMIAGYPGDKVFTIHDIVPTDDIIRHYFKIVCIQKNGYKVCTAVPRDSPTDLTIPEETRQALLNYNPSLFR